MARMTVGKGITDYIGRLEKLSTASEEMIGRSIYPGAKIVTDQVAKNIQGLSVDNKGFKSGKKISTITEAQKRGLAEGLGIAHMRREGSYQNVKVGMDGYNATKSHKYPNGQPNALIARSVESGTSFRRKTPFISNAVNATRTQAEMAMAQEFDKQLEQIF